MPGPAPLARSDSAGPQPVDEVALTSVAASPRPLSRRSGAGSTCCPFARRPPRFSHEAMAVPAQTAPGRGDLISPAPVRQRFLLVLKHTLNRVTSRLARAGRGPFSLVRHVGRSSGRTYDTPVILAEVPEDSSPSSPTVRWSAGTGTSLLRVAASSSNRRREYRVTQIERCSAENTVAARFPPQRGSF